MLYDKIKEYTSSGAYPMHMPGHKRNTALPVGAMPYGIDITEIHGFDNLHDMRGILLETANIAAELYRSSAAFPLVGGSTAGILSAIAALTARGEKILMARNCHMSVYNAAALLGLDTAYLLPETDILSGVSCGISPEYASNALRENRDAKLLVITSPTYDGVVSDIARIAKLSHSYGIPLLVDAAHGAHLGFCKSFPESPVHSGADVTVMSLHKTLPALTQCALLHVCGNIVNPDKIARQLAVFQTSSPSYVLLSSIDICLRLLREESERLFGNYSARLAQFSGGVKSLKKLSVLCHGRDSIENHPGFYAFDPGKIVIGTGETEISGSKLAALLRDRYRIELEMAQAHYAVAMTSICDSDEGFSRLLNALKEIDSGIKSAPAARHLPFHLPRKAYTLNAALTRQTRQIQFSDAAGLVSLEYIWAYPPGIPLIAPGEIIDVDIISAAARLMSSGVILNSTMGGMPLCVYVCDA